MLSRRATARIERPPRLRLYDGALTDGRKSGRAASFCALAYVLGKQEDRDVGSPMNERQRAVLEWIAAGCRPGEEPVERHRQTAASLAGRGLVQLDREYGKPWRAWLTPLGRYWIEHRSYPPQGTVLEPLIETGPEPAEAGDSLSDAEFINRRRIMKADWSQHGFALIWLEPDEQRTLHYAFQPSKERLSDADALEDYRAMEETEPGRMAEAAEVWDRYERAFETARATAARQEAMREAGIKPPRKRQKDRELTIRALARPEIDLEKLAQVLIHVAAQDARRQAEDPALSAEEKERATSAAALLAKMESQPMKVPPSRLPRKKKTPVVHRAMQKVPPAIDAKVKEAWSCHQAGSELAAVLVARSAVADMLTDCGAPTPSDDLGTALTRLVDTGRLTPSTAQDAGALRCLTVVPGHPPVTTQETSALLNVIVRILSELYPGGVDI